MSQKIITNTKNHFKFILFPLKISTNALRAVRCATVRRCVRIRTVRTSASVITVTSVMGRRARGSVQVKSS